MNNDSNKKYNIGGWKFYKVPNWFLGLMVLFFPASIIVWALLGSVIGADASFGVFIGGIILFGFVVVPIYLEIYTRRVDREERERRNRRY